jgi:hypothetical protein
MQRQQRAKKFWHITGLRSVPGGFDTICEVTIPIGCRTEAQLKNLLKCLCAKAEFDYDEIVGAYVKGERGVRIIFSSRNVIMNRGIICSLLTFSFSHALSMKKEIV